MDGLIELAIAVGRLENRVQELEKRLLEQKQENAPAYSINLGGQEDDRMSPDKLLQQGIDNIMGYQWPPAKGED